MGLRTGESLLAASFCLLLIAPLDAGQNGRARGQVGDRGRQQSNRSAYDEGFRDGLRQGEADARSGRPFGSGSTSDRSDYRLAFADGYRTGYDRQRAADPFRQDRQHVNQPLRESREHVNEPMRIDRQHANEPLRARPEATVSQPPRAIGRGYREPAVAAGFESGYEKGIEDGRAAERYDPVRHRDYRDAERGYRDAYGARDAYRTNFRSGFRQGYEEGYRAGTRNRR
jgi:flagellar biosynthesis/type III secretory pathway protein FliH